MVKIISIIFALTVIISVILGFMTRNKRMHNKASLNILTVIFVYGAFIMAYDFITRFGNMIQSSSNVAKNTSILSGIICMVIIIVMYVFATICSHILFHRGLCNAWIANISHKPIRLNK